MRTRLLNSARLVVRLLPVLLLPVLAHCAAGTRSRSEEPAPRTGPTVRVYNDNTEDLRVFLLLGTTRVPLGTVESFTARTIDIPTTACRTPVRLVVQTFASRTSFATRDWDFVTLPRAELRIGTNLRVTTLSVGR